MLISAISNFFDVKSAFKKDDVEQKNFIQELGLLIVKNHSPF
jgi:hypothetical protein